MHTLFLVGYHQPPKSFCRYTSLASIVHRAMCANRCLTHLIKELLFDCIYMSEGTDEKAIIEVLARCNNEQRQKTKLLFKTMYGKVGCECFQDAD